MKLLLVIATFCTLAITAYSQEKDQSRVTSTIDSSDVENVVLTQTMTIAVPIAKVWEAYTTAEGWENWAVAKAEIDFKLGGLIRTTYDKDTDIGDEGTITLRVINYVPHQMITLQADISANFPEFMKEDAEHMYNTILFEEVSPSKTKITSYGIGYKNNDKYKSLLEFFIKGNEMSYINLITYLETGKPSANY